MGNLASIPTHPPAPAVMAILSRFDREQLAGFIEIAIELADPLDGDPDLEGSCDEDEISRCTDFGRPASSDGPGCIIADPDEGVDDKGEQTFAEDDWCYHGDHGPGCPIADPDSGSDGS